MKNRCPSKMVNAMEEIWKDIDGYSGYQVSNLGRVRTHNKVTHNALHSERKWADRIMKQKISKKDKSARIELWKGGTHKTVLVHRLVANAFLEKPIDTDMTVNHKDGNRLNNRLDNLEWLTLGDNIRHGFDNNLYTNQINCILIDRSGHAIGFNSLSKASLFLGRSVGYISGNLKHNKPITNTKGVQFDVRLSL